VQSALDAAMIDQVIDVHLKGALYVCQPAFRLMRAQGYGRVVKHVVGHCAYCFYDCVVRAISTNVRLVPWGSPERY